MIQYNAITLSDSKDIIITRCSLVHTAIFKCNINEQVNYSSSIVQGDKILTSSRIIVQNYVIRI